MFCFIFSNSWPKEAGFAEAKVCGVNRRGGGRWPRAHGGQTCICCCSLLFSVCSWRLHSSSSPTRASSSDTTSSSSCFRAASRPRVSSVSAHNSASARSCSARRARSSSSWGWGGRSASVRWCSQDGPHWSTRSLLPPELLCPLRPGGQEGGMEDSPPSCSSG